uniref:Uncharacterized protein n=1 Tax=Erythrolobus australicus TaxID=1077150 RepID=A0A7S1TJB3_9RHOD
MSSTHSSSEQQLEHRSSASSADGTATVIYKSETVRPHRADGFARFKVIKITQADLGSARDPVLRIEWFQHLRAGQDCSPRSLGSIELSRDSILAVAPGSTLPFHPSSGLIATTSAAVRGTVRVQQAEDLSDRAFFALCAEFAVANSAGMPRSNTR